jgi:acetylornithine/succinyldiaminopimelate/putrescine aminotransferase
MAAIKGALTEAGLLAFVVENRIHVVPPCTISAEQVAKGLAIFDSVFARFASWRNKPTRVPDSGASALSGLPDRTTP